MATLKFYLRNAYSGGIPRKDAVTISAKFTISREKRFELKTEEKILPRFWDSRTQCVKSNAPDHLNINLYLQDFKRNILNLYRENHLMPFDKFKELARGKSGLEEKKTLRHALLTYYDNAQRDKDKKSSAKIAALLTHLEPSMITSPSKRKRATEGYFTKHPLNFNFKNLDLNFYDNFKQYMFAKGLLDSSTFKYISMLCSFLRWATDRGYAVNPIFEKWDIVHHEPKPVPLTMEELLTLESAILPKGPSIGRDFLVLESRTGQRISDLNRFDLRDYNHEEEVWKFYRKKGNNIKAKQVSVYFKGFCAPALDILKKHNFKLPPVADQTINEWIKEACELAGITSEIKVERWQSGRCTIERVRKCELMSTHTGRKTFITLGLQYMPPKIVKDLAGISSYKTLKHYEGGSEASAIEMHLTDMDQKMKLKVV